MPVAASSSCACLKLLVVGGTIAWIIMSLVRVFISVDSDMLAQLAVCYLMYEFYRLFCPGDLVGDFVQGCESVLLAKEVFFSQGRYCFCFRRLTGDGIWYERETSMCPGAYRGCGVGVEPYSVFRRV